TSTGHGCTEGGIVVKSASPEVGVCNGAKGSNGSSVTNTAVPAGDAAKCEERGGAEFKVGVSAATFACNGKEGSPWTAGGTLPPAAIEAGGWSVYGSLAQRDSSGSMYAPISFPIKLATSLEEAEIHITGDPDFDTYCSSASGANVFVHGQMCIWSVSLSEMNVR